MKLSFLASIVGSLMVMMMSPSNEINAFPIEQPTHFLPYSFGYQTADGQSRQEQGQNGVVTGSFSYTDANGDLRKVKYTADKHGYRPEGDVGVDRRTAEAAASLAALAPKSPIQQSWQAPATASAPVAYQPYDRLIVSAPVITPAPFQTSWNDDHHYSSHQSPPSSSVSFIPSNPPIIGPSGYQVDAPSHKIWVKYL